MSSKHSSGLAPSSATPPSSAAANANITNVYTNMKEHILPDLRIHSNYLDEALQAILHTLLFVRAPTDVRPRDSACEKLAPIIFATCGLPDLDSKVITTVDLLKRSLVISSSGQHLRGEITLSFYQRKENRGWLYSNTEHAYFERWRLPVTVLDFQGNTNINSNSLSNSVFHFNSNNNNNNSSSTQRRHSTGGPSANSTTTAGIGYFQNPNTLLQNNNSNDNDNNNHDGQAQSSSTPAVDPLKAYLQAYDLVTKSIMFILETANTTTTQVPSVPYFFELNVSDALELRQTPAFHGNNSGILSSNNSGKFNNGSAVGKTSPMVPASSNRRM